MKFPGETSAQFIFAVLCLLVFIDVFVTVNNGTSAQMRGNILIATQKEDTERLKNMEAKIELGNTQRERLTQGQVDLRKALVSAGVIK